MPWGVLWFSILATYNAFKIYDTNIISPYEKMRENYTNKISSFQGIESPYKYWILIPKTINLVRNTLDVSHLTADRIVALASLLLTFSSIGFLTLHIVSNSKFKLLLSVIAMALFYLPTSSTFVYHGYQPWSYLEPFFLCVVIYAIRTKNLPVFIISTLLAVFNRETGVLMGLLILKRLNKGYIF